MVVFGEFPPGTQSWSFVVDGSKTPLHKHIPSSPVHPHLSWSSPGTTNQPLVPGAVIRYNWKHPKEMLEADLGKVGLARFQLSSVIRPNIFTIPFLASLRTLCILNIDYFDYILFERQRVRARSSICWFTLQTPTTTTVKSG